MVLTKAGRTAALLTTAVIGAGATWFANYNHPDYALACTDLYVVASVQREIPRFSAELRQSYQEALRGSAAKRNDFVREYVNEKWASERGITFVYNPIDRRNRMGANSIAGYLSRDRAGLETALLHLYPEAFSSENTPLEDLHHAVEHEYGHHQQQLDNTLIEFATPPGSDRPNSTLLYLLEELDASRQDLDRIGLGRRLNRSCYHGVSDAAGKHATLLWLWSEMQIMDGEFQGLDSTAKREIIEQFRPDTIPAHVRLRRIAPTNQ